MEKNKAAVLKKYPKAHCLFYKAFRIGESDHFRIYDHNLADAFLIGRGTTEETAWALAAFQLPKD